MAAKTESKFTDEGIGASNTGRFDFLGDAAVVDDALMAKLERAKRETSSELRNRVGGLLYAFEQSGQNEIMFDHLPTWAMGEDGNPLVVEHGRAKDSPITLKSLYSAARAIVNEANGNMPVRVVWSEKAQVFALQRTDTEYEPTLKPRLRKEKTEDADADAENTEPVADATADADAE